MKLKEKIVQGLVRRYWVEDGLIYAKGSRLYVPSGAGLRRELMRETHDPVWAGHPGVERMLALLGRSYFWPKMSEDVEGFVRTCLVCQLDKTDRRAEAGLLQPLPVPDKPWQSISMDFIVGFPLVNGMRSILVCCVHSGPSSMHDKCGGRASVQACHQVFRSAQGYYQ